MLTLTKADASALSFQQYRVAGNKAEFLGPTADDKSIEQLLLTSTAPKRGNGQYGNRRSSLSLVRGTSVEDLAGDTTVRNRKFEIGASLPVGTTDEQIIEDAHELGAKLQDTSFVISFFRQGIIEY